MKTKEYTLLCGCCGKYFRGINDTDQDAGYGHCQECKDWIWEKDKKEIDKSISLIYEHLSETNQKKLDSMSYEEKLWLVDQAFKDGILSWSIGK